MGVNSNNRVKPNTLVEVRLSCGCVWILTIFIFNLNLETFITVNNIVVKLMSKIISFKFFDMGLTSLPPIWTM